MINLPVFPVRTPQSFDELLLASAPDRATGKPDPARMQAFLAEYPESARATQVIHGHLMSSGFEDSTFNSLNAFRFNNDAGAVTWVRWAMVPAQPFEPIRAADSGQADKNYLPRSKEVERPSSYAGQKSAHMVDGAGHSGRQCCRMVPESKHRMP